MMEMAIPNQRNEDNKNSNEDNNARKNGNDTNSKCVRFNLIPLIKTIPLTIDSKTKDECQKSKFDSIRQELFYQKEDFERFRKEARNEQLMQIYQQRQQQQREAIPNVVVAVDSIAAAAAEFSPSFPSNRPHPGRLSAPSRRACGGAAVAAQMFQIRETKSKHTKTTTKTATAPMSSSEKQQEDSMKSIQRHGVAIKISPMTMGRRRGQRRQRRRLQVSPMNATATASSSPRIIASISRTAEWI